MSSLLPLWSWGGTQAVRFDGTCISPLNHLTGAKLCICTLYLSEVLSVRSTEISGRLTDDAEVPFTTYSSAASEQMPHSYQHTLLAQQ